MGAQEFLPDGDERPVDFHPMHGVGMAPPRSDPGQNRADADREHMVAIDHDQRVGGVGCAGRAPSVWGLIRHDLHLFARHGGGHDRGRDFGGDVGGDADCDRLYRIL